MQTSPTLTSAAATCDAAARDVTARVAGAAGQHQADAYQAPLPAAAGAAAAPRHPQQPGAPRASDLRAPRRPQRGCAGAEQEAQEAHAAGRRHQNEGAYSAAEACYRRALALRLGAGSAAPVAYSRFQMAMLSHLRGREDAQGFALAHQALAAALREDLPPRVRGDMLQNLAFCEQHAGRFAAALGRYQDALRARDEAEDVRGHALTRGRMAECLLAMGAPAAHVRVHLEVFDAFFRPRGDAARLRQADAIEAGLRARRDAG